MRASTERGGGPAEPVEGFGGMNCSEKDRTPQSASLTAPLSGAPCAYCSFMFTNI